MAELNGKLNKLEDIIISGISGSFPQSSNIEEFKENLFAGKDLIQPTDRWGNDFPDVPLEIGGLKHLNKFDYAFFRILRKQAEGMNVAARLLLEKTFEAILDAGYNPEQLRGTKTGVFYATCNMETGLMTGAGDFPVEIDGFAELGKINSQIPNRISYFLDVHGPSLYIDTACSSSIYALDSAYKSIQNGDCDAAIVCTANVDLSPYTSQLLNAMGVLAPNGYSRPFDEKACGFTRAEAVVAVFLQKFKDARRVYAHLVHTKTNCDGFTQDGITHPSGDVQKELYKSFYNDIGIAPQSVSYVEAHGTGTMIGDIVEVEGIEDVFCNNRNSPLKIGSVKSNMGHGEGSSGLCSLAKMIVAFETGLIPSNIHFDTPNPKIKGLHNGNIEVVTKPTPCDGEFYAINSYGIGGANGHLLLSPFKKSKKLTNLVEIDELPYLVTISGRTEEGVNVIMNDLEKNFEDVEYIRLFHEIFSENISGHIHRGHIILQKHNHQRNIKFFSGEKRPIWFVFSGMGSQWSTMGKSLMTIPLFAESISRSHKILQKKGVDLIRIITSDDPEIFKNILNSFVGIAAIQVALIDILRAIDIHPDGIIGHSVGELGCAYADGCFTREQMILASYLRGLVSLETEFIHGTMAAVGVGYNAIKDMVPPEIDVACHNGPTSCTISGPTKVVKYFMKELETKSVFVREVNTSNIPYHSRYISSAGSKLVSYLKEIIPDPKLRTSKWICTSALENKLNQDETKYSSAEYHANNLLNPVYFEEGLRHIPDKAITIEISPHGLLQAILKRSLPSTVDNIPLTLKGHENSAKFLLNSLGRLYEIGLTPKLSNLYPPVRFPVSRKTPMISPLIKWQHDEEWSMTKFSKKKVVSGERDVTIHLQHNSYQYLHGHVVNENKLFPGFAFLEIVHETVALISNMNIKKVPVIFENVRFERAISLPTEGSISFHISIQKVTGCFLVTENGIALVSGIVRVPEDIDKETFDVSPLVKDASDSSDMLMNTTDFYKELRLRGYHYTGLFKKVVSCNFNGTQGKTLWCDNMVTFLDTVAQITILSIDSRELMIPIFIRKLVIDVEKHFAILDTLAEEKPEFPIYHYRDLELVCCGGIQLNGLKGYSVSREKNQEKNLVLEKYEFVPYISEEPMDLQTAARIFVHLVVECSILKVKMNTIEILDESYNHGVPLFSNFLANALNDYPQIQGNVNVFTNLEFKPTIEHSLGITLLDGELPNDENYNLAVLPNIQHNANLWGKIFHTLKDDAFIITLASNQENILFEKLGLSVCFSRTVNANKKILLLCKVIKSNSAPITLKIQNTSYSWISEIQKVLWNIEFSDKNLVVYAEKEPLSGINGFFNCLRKEKHGKKIRCFYLMDENAPDFSLENPFYKSQYIKNLSNNFYKNGQWGSYRHLPLETPSDVEALHAYCNITLRGDLSTLKLIQGPINPVTYSQQSEKSLTHVYYSGLNLRDVQFALGKISSMNSPYYSRLLECYLGFEYSGKDSDGTRCMGLAISKTFASVVEDNLLKLKVPNHMTLEDAATIPVPYATVILAFNFVINLRPGSSVLILASSDGLGEAAINICLHYKCNIFVIVDSRGEMEFINKTFPQIPEANIGITRNTSFEKLVMARTNGRGVDVVLNTSTGEKLRASLRCVATRGHFLQIGRFDMVQNEFVDMGYLLQAVSFHCVELDNFTHAHSSEEGLTLEKKMQDMLDNGIIKPLHRTVYNIKEIKSAFEYVAAQKHIGKVVVKVRDEEEDIHAKPVPITLEAQPRVWCEGSKSYIIIGGLGGFGLELADWLIIRGARNIILSSRKGIRTGYQAYRIQLWESYGVNVVVSTEDVTTEVGATSILQKANRLGSVEGIFNLAVILEDAVFREQTIETFETVVHPKATATIHFDRLSRRLCPHLKYFVGFSSIVSGRGNAEQTNYGMANSIMESVCEVRKTDNLPALCVQWGAIGEVGAVVDFDEDNSTITVGGTSQQKITSALQTLDLLMNQSHPLVCSMVIAKKNIHDVDIINTVANILGIKDLRTISLDWTLPELGMDSVLSIELKQIIETEFETFLSSTDIKSMTFAKLYNLKEKKMLSGENKQSHFKQIMNEETLKTSLIQIPFNRETFNGEISIQHNSLVFLLPGVEGMAEFMESLAKNLLPLQSFCFQYFLNASNSTFQEQCEYFAKLITDKLGPDQKFYIITYSLGTTLGVEVVRILEKQGRKGHLWFIDGSPDYVMSVVKIKSKTNKVTEDEAMQSFACIHIIKTLMPEKWYDEFPNDLQNTGGWEAKKNFCSTLFPKKLWSKSHPYFDKVYFFMNELRTIAETPQIETPCTLIRSMDNILNLDECYGLSKYIKYPVGVHKINADHYTIIRNEETADIILSNEIWGEKLTNGNS